MAEGFLMKLPCVINCTILHKTIHSGILPEFSVTWYTPGECSEFLFLLGTFQEPSGNLLEIVRKPSRFFSGSFRTILLVNVQSFYSFYETSRNLPEPSGTACFSITKKHAARAPVGEGGKDGGSQKRWEGGKVVRKVGIPCGRCRKQTKKHAARTLVGDGGGEDSAQLGLPPPVL